jgi:hypothetical protein
LNSEISKVDIMKNILSAVLVFLLIMAYGCDSNTTSFEDTIPLYSLSTQVSPAEGGTITPAEGEFNSGDGIKIEAHPAEGYVFDHWDDDLSGSENPEMLQFNSNLSVTAHFIKLEHQLNIEVMGEGSVKKTVVEQSGDAEGASTTIELTAHAETGWTFDRWEGDLAGSNNPETIVLDEDKEVVAVFSEQPAEINPSNSSVTADPENLQVGNHSTVTVELRDDANNPVEGLEEEAFVIEITGNASAGTISETDVSGKYEFEVTNNSIEEVTVSVTVNDTELDDKPVIAFEIGDPHTIEIVVQPEDTQSGQPIKGPPAVRVTDEFDHPVAGVTVSVREKDGQEFSSGDLEVTTDEDGIAEFDNLVIHSSISWFILVFSVDGIESVESERFRVSVLDR